MPALKSHDKLSSPWINSLSFQATYQTTEKKLSPEYDATPNRTPEALALAAKDCLSKQA